MIGWWLLAWVGAAALRIRLAGRPGARRRDED
jgi:hypothetical protein